MAKAPSWFLSGDGVTRYHRGHGTLSFDRWSHCDSVLARRWSAGARRL